MTYRDVALFVAAQHQVVTRWVKFQAGTPPGQELEDGGVHCVWGHVQRGVVGSAGSAAAVEERW